MERKIILQNRQALGDAVMVSYAVKALHEQYPGRYITDVSTAYPDVFHGNPYITRLGRRRAETIELAYPTIKESNKKPYHFVNAFGHDLSEKLGIRLEPTEWTGAIWITETEKMQQPPDKPYWVINAGHKSDFTLKAWDFRRYQAVVDRFPDLQFIQVGSQKDTHPILCGKNLTSMVGRTTVRQLIRLIWRAAGVITPVSAAMHMAYACPGRRASIVIAGGREPSTWQHAPCQQFLHTCGMLPCCRDGGCWKSRAVRLEDGSKEDDYICANPVLLPTGQWVGQCMDMISVDDVCGVVTKYLRPAL